MRADMDNASMATNESRMRKAAARRARIVLLRDYHKWTFARIGQKFGFTRARAFMLYKKEKANAQAQNAT